METKLKIIGKPLEQGQTRSEKEINQISYDLLNLIETHWRNKKITYSISRDGSLRNLFSHFAKYGYWDYKITLISQDITMAGQAIQRYHFTAESGSESKHLATINKIFIDGEDYFSVSVD